MCVCVYIFICICSFKQAFKKFNVSRGQCGSVVELLLCTEGLPVPSPIWGVQGAANQCFTHNDLFLFLSFLLSENQLKKNL